MNKLNLLFIFCLLLASCRTDQKKTDILVFTGATLIDGTGVEPVADAVMIIENGKISAVGKRAEIKIPDGAEIVDVSGKFIMPGIINTHGHVGDVKGIEGGHYSKQNLEENLALYARYGVTTVVSLGGDKVDAESLRMVNDTLAHATQRARLFICGEVITGKTPEEGMAIVDANDTMGVDWMKIRIDDNLGTSEKVPEEVYRAAIRHAGDLGYKTATHIYYLEDARRAIDAGSAMIAHS
ncbi:MAG TPA: hypothetical protein PLR06_14635, partial [Cyclobacteriaceae bacterium]|nr:hypothetical protein [Cyclobacteriaceae bacterium]